MTEEELARFAAVRARAAAALAATDATLAAPRPTLEEREALEHWMQEAGEVRARHEQCATSAEPVKAAASRDDAQSYVTRSAAPAALSPQASVSELPPTENLRARVEALEEFVIESVRDHALKLRAAIGSVEDLARRLDAFEAVTVNRERKRKHK